LLTLYLTAQKNNFYLLISFLDPNGNYAFQTFQNGTAYYLDNKEEEFVKTVKETLKGTPLEQWASYSHLVQSYKIFGE
jgi:hypothetical protein